MKHLLLFCIAIAFVATTKAQQTITPDTLVSINADNHCWAEKDHLFEFSDGSKAVMLSGQNTVLISNVVDDTSYAISNSNIFRTLYVVDSNYQYKNAISVKLTKYFQVGDTLYGTANVQYGETLDLNPAGSPFLVTSPTNPDTQFVYLVAYDKNLQLVQQSLITANRLTFGDIAAIKNGKIYVTSNERDDHPQGTQFTTLTANLETYDMAFNLLASHTYYTRPASFTNFHVLHYFQATDDGFYGYFANMAVGHDIDIGLNGQPAIRTSDRLNLGYLVKYDNNFNIIWDSRITYPSATFISTNRIYDSPNGDSLLWVGLQGANYMYYQNGTATDTMMKDTSIWQSEHICTINRNTGQLQRHHSADLNFIYGDGIQMVRYAISEKSNFSPGITRDYLNFLDNTFPVPDSTSAIAFYDDPTTGIPSTYRLLGYLGPNDDYWPNSMLNSTTTNTLYMAGQYRNGYKLDNTSSFTLPDYNGTTSAFLAAYSMSPLTGTPELSAPEFKLFPNPATDFVQIDPGSRNAVSIQLVSLEGKVLKNRSVSGMEKVRIETGSLPAGLYFVQVTYRNGEKLGKRFVKR